MNIAHNFLRLMGAVALKRPNSFLGKRMAIKEHINDTCFYPVVRGNIATHSDGRKYLMRPDGWRRLKDAEKRD